MLSGENGFQKSGHRDGVEDFVDYILTADVFGLGLIADPNTVTEDIQSTAFDIIGNDIATPIEKGPAFGRHLEVNGGPGRGPGTDVVVQIKIEGPGIPGRKDQRDNESLILSSR